MGGFKSQSISPTTIVYAASSPRHVILERQQFTPLDRHVGTNRCVLPWAFLYSITLQPEALQAALAETLNHFPTLSARVHPVAASSRLSCCHFGSDADALTTTSRPARKPDWDLLLCNAGVPFTVHSSTCSLQELLQSGFMNSRHGFTFPDNGNKACLPSYMEPLDPVSVLSGSAPVMAVRLTQLAGGGSILAVTAAHVVLDGRSYVTFMKHWASQYNALTAAQVTTMGPAHTAVSIGATAVDTAAGSTSNSAALFNKSVLNDIAARAGTASHKPATAAPEVQRSSSAPHTEAAAVAADHDAVEVTKRSTADTAAESPAPAGTSVSHLSGFHQPLSPRDSVTSGRVTIISNCASQHPSSTTAEAPDESSVQLSISASSTASTILSTLSAAGAGHCQQPFNTVAGLGIQQGGRRHSVDTTAPLPVAPQAAAAAVPNTAAGGSNFGKQPSLLATAPATATAAVGPAVAIQAVHVQQSDGHTASGSPAGDLHVHALPQQGTTSAGPHPQVLKPQEQLQRAQEAAMQRSDGPKPLSPAPDPLCATSVPPPGWLPALRSVRAAYQQIKAEEGHIKRALKEGVIPLSVKSEGASSNNISIVSGKNAANAVAAATVKGIGAAKALPKVDLNILSTELLYIPGSAVQRLKAAVSQYLDEGQYVSSNDVLSSLVWVLMCYLRKRPLPGQTRPPDMQDTYFGVALDLRTAVATPTEKPGSNMTAIPHHNRLQAIRQQEAQQGAVPGNYFGSAAWSVSVCSCDLADHSAVGESPMLPVGWHQRLNPREWQILCSDEGVLLRSLAAGAVSIRGALQALRQDGKFTARLLQQIDESIVAPLSSQLSNGADFVRRLDGFATSWQFGLWDVNFGGQQVYRFQGVVHPVPPYHAVIIPNCPSAIALSAAMVAASMSNAGVQDQLSAADVLRVGAAEAGDGIAKLGGSINGVLLSLTVPKCLVEAMIESPIFQLLLPEAAWDASTQT